MKEEKLNVINIKDGRTGTISKRSWELSADPDGGHNSWELTDNIGGEKILISENKEIIVEQIGGEKKIPISEEVIIGVSDNGKEKKEAEKQYPLNLSVGEIMEKIKNDAFSKEELIVLSTDKRKSVVKFVIPKLK